MADYFLPAIRRKQPTGPYLLGGHSLGALFAFEMARKLRAGGEEVGLLALLGCPGPGARVTLMGKLHRHRMALSQLEYREKVAYIKN